MRLLHFLNSAHGGATSGTLEFIKYANDINDNVQHIILYPGHSKDLRFEKLQSENMVFIPLRYGWWNYTYRLNLIQRMVVRLKSNIMTFFGIIPLFQIFKILKKYKVELIYTTSASVKLGKIASNIFNLPHIWHIKEEIGLGKFMQFPLSDEKLAKYIGSGETKIICMSHYVSTLFSSNNIPYNVVHDGINFDTINKEELIINRKVMRDSYGIKDSDILIGMVSAPVSQIKRHELFIKAISHLSQDNLKFIVFGSIPAKGHPSFEYFNELNTLIDSYPRLKEKFIWAGNKFNFSDIYSGLDLFVHTCEVEGFGRVVIEAMVCGVPVITPDKGGAAEINNTENSGLRFKSNDASSLMEKIDLMVNQEELRKRFIESGRIHAELNFSVKKHYNEIMKIIRNYGKN